MPFNPVRQGDDRMQKKLAEIKVHDSHGKYTGMIFSILYLSLEVRKMGLRKTADRIESSMDTFFADLEKIGDLDSDLVQLHELLVKVLSLSHQEIAAFLAYAASAESADVN